MSNPPGIDLDQLFSRLHTGMLGLQSWRDHRRARQADAPHTAATSPTAVAAASSPTMPSPHGPLEPQGFVDIGGRLLPVFGDRPSPSATPTTTEPPAPPTPAPPSAEAPRPTRLNAAVLKMPLPTPPACLGRTSAPPADDGEPAPATEPTPTVPSSATTGATSIAPTLEVMLQRRSDAEATRLEQVHAEHRALLATLLDEHRAQLAEQAEATARREHQIVRDLLAEHRAQLEAHAEAMRNQQTRHREEMQTLVAAANQAAEGHASSIADLQALLAEQAKLQAQGHEQTEQHIGDLADVLGGLGQTVGQLAAATFERKREPAPAFLPPPRPAASGPASAVQPPSSPPTPTAPAADLAAQPDHPPMPAPPLDRTSRLSASSDVPPTASPAPMQQHAASSARTRVAALVDEFDDDDDDLKNIDDPDEPPPRARLSPITPLEHSDPSEPAHV